MTTIVIFALTLATALAILTLITRARARRRSTLPEALATERTHTTTARAVGGIWGVHGAGTEATYGLTAPESTRTFH